jgi:hypothetical protein
MQPPGAEPGEQAARKDELQVVTRPAEEGREDGVLLGGYDPADLIAELAPDGAPLEGEPRDDDKEVKHNDEEQHAVGQRAEQDRREVEGRVQEYGAQEPQEGRDGLQDLVVHEGHQTDTDPRQRGEGRVGEAPEDPAHHERLDTELHAVEYVLSEGEPEAHRGAVDDAVHHPRELYDAAPARREVSDKEDHEQGEPLGALLYHGRRHQRREEVRDPHACHRAQRDLEEGVEHAGDRRRHREPPQEDRYDVAQRFPLVEIYNPNKEQVDHGLHDPGRDQRAA